MWFVFPRLGRESGLWARIEDVFRVAFAIGLAGAVAGTLMLPLIGTTMGIGLSIMMPILLPQVGLVYLPGALAAIGVARIRVALA